jgi:hypothetical protein
VILVKMFVDFESIPKQKNTICRDTFGAIWVGEFEYFSCQNYDVSEAHRLKILRKFLSRFSSECVCQRFFHRNSCLILRQNLNSEVSELKNVVTSYYKTFKNLNIGKVDPDRKVSALKTGKLICGHACLIIRMYLFYYTSF